MWSDPTIVCIIKQKFEASKLVLDEQIKKFKATAIQACQKWHAEKACPADIVKCKKVAFKKVKRVKGVA